MRKNLKSEIGGRLREYIDNNYVSITELTKELGKGRGYFGSYFAGKSMVGGEILYQLAKRGADINYILTGKSFMSSELIVKLKSLREEVNSLKASIYDISKENEDKNNIINQIIQIFKEGQLVEPIRKEELNNLLKKLQGKISDDSQL